MLLLLTSQVVRDKKIDILFYNQHTVKLLMTALIIMAAVNKFAFLIFREVAIVAEVQYILSNEEIQSVTLNLSKNLLTVMCQYLTFSKHQICRFEHFIPDLGLTAFAENRTLA